MTPFSFTHLSLTTAIALSSTASFAQQEAIRLESLSQQRAQTVVAAPSLPPTSSRYFFAPGDEKNTVTLSYGNTTKKSTRAFQYESADQKATNIDFGIYRGIGAGQTLSLATGYRSMTESYTDSKYNYNGLTDIHLGYQAVSQVDSGNLIYGGTLGIPPAQQASADAFNEGNSTTGAFSLNPMIGYEDHAVGGIVGAKASTNIFALQSARNGDASAPGPIFNLDAFYEFAITKEIDLGVTAGLSRNQQEVYGNQWVNVRRAKIYGEGELMEDMMLNAGIKAETEEYTRTETSTSFSIGLRKNL